MTGGCDGSWLVGWDEVFSTTRLLRLEGSDTGVGAVLEGVAFEKCLLVTPVSLRLDSGTLVTMTLGDAGVAA